MPPAQLPDRDIDRIFGCLGCILDQALDSLGMVRPVELAAQPVEDGLVLDRRQARQQFRNRSVQHVDPRVDFSVGHPSLLIRHCTEPAPGKAERP